MTERKFKKSTLNSDAINEARIKSASTFKLIDNYKTLLRDMYKDIQMIVEDKKLYFDKYNVIDEKQINDKKLGVLSSLGKNIINFLVSNINYGFDNGKLALNYKDPYTGLNKRNIIEMDLVDGKIIKALYESSTKLNEENWTGKLSQDASAALEFLYLLSFGKKMSEISIVMSDLLRNGLQPFINAYNGKENLIADIYSYQNIYQKGWYDHINNFHDKYERFLSLSENVKLEEIKSEVNEDKGWFETLLKNTLGTDKIDFSGKAQSKKEEVKDNTQSLWQKLWGSFKKPDNKVEEKKSPIVKDSKVDTHSNDKTIVTIQVQSEKAPTGVVQIQDDKPLSNNAVAVDSPQIVNTIHSYNNKIGEAIIDYAKMTCFADVIALQQQESACMINRPNVNVEEMDKYKCDDITKRVTIASKNCETIYPMAAKHDAQLEELMRNSVTIEAEITASGMSMNTHKVTAFINLVHDDYFTNQASQDILTNAYENGVNVNNFPMLGASQDVNVQHALPAPAAN
jgi:hypothetical protein